METGETGPGGLTAPGLVEQGGEADQEDAATQQLLMEAENVRDRARSLENATQTLVQVKPLRPKQGAKYKQQCLVCLPSQN